MGEVRSMVQAEHRIAVYDDPAALARLVADLVETSLADGVPVVTISRPAHRRAVADLLTDRGVDVAGATGRGAFVPLDADATLSRFVVDGRPDPELFAAVAASLLPTDGGPLNLFGEAVVLLWERGEVVAALELEELWNTAIAGHPVRVLCAYPGELLASSDLRDVARVCDVHDHLSLLGAHPAAAGPGPGAADSVLSSVHLPVPAAIASVRHFVRDTLDGWGLHALSDDAVLVTSELATNAVRHGSSPFRTTVVRADGVVRVAVEDGSSAWPERQHPGADDQDGRGLAIVAALSHQTGCDATSAGKIAWAELAL